MGAIWDRRPSAGDPRDRFCGSWRMYLPGSTFVPHGQCWMAIGLRENREFDGEEVVIEREDELRLTPGDVAFDHENGHETPEPPAKLVRRET